MKTRQNEIPTERNPIRTNIQNIAHYCQSSVKLSKTSVKLLMNAFFTWIKPQCGCGASTTSPVRREQTMTPNGRTISGIAPSPKPDLDTYCAADWSAARWPGERAFPQIAAGGLPPPSREAKQPSYVKKDERVQEYLQRCMSPPQSDIDHNNVIDTRVCCTYLHTSSANILCMDNARFSQQADNCMQSRPN